MSEDKLEEINKRLEGNYIVYSDWNGIPVLNAEWSAQDDVKWLISELEQSRAEVKRLKSILANQGTEF